MKSSKNQNTPTDTLQFKLTEIYKVAGVIPAEALPNFMKLMVIVAKYIDKDTEMYIDLSTNTVVVPRFKGDGLGEVAALYSCKLEGMDELHVPLVAQTVPGVATQSSPAPVPTPAPVTPVTPVEEVSDLSSILKLMESNKVEIKEGYSQLSKVISENDSHYRSRLTGVENSLADISKAIGNPSPDESSDGWSTKEYCLAGAGVAALGGAIYFMTR